jgi:hypothetical protein
MIRLRPYLLAIAAIAIASTDAFAQDVGMCPSNAYGVPWLGGPPVWRDFSGGGASACGSGGIDCKHDDPRWRGAAALTYNSASGSANPPVQFRTLWSNQGGTKALYMQWVIRIGVSDTGTGTDARTNGSHDIFFGFERAGAAAVSPDPAALAVGNEHSWVVQVHLNPAGTITDGIAGGANEDLRQPTRCTTSTCPATGDWYLVYQNSQDAGGAPTTGTCSTVTGPAANYSRTGDDPAWLKNSIQVERICSGTTQETCDLWVVSVRVPLVAATAPRAATIHNDGIEESEGPLNAAVPGFWYQVNFGAYDDDGSIITPRLFAKIDGWPAPQPRTSGPPVLSSSDAWCEDSGIYYKDVDTDTNSAAAWANLRLWDGFSARPSDCLDGFAITPDDIGVLVRDFGTAAPTDVVTPALDYQFKAFTSGTTRATNRVVARAVNHGDNATNVQIKARFRLAQWGAQPWATGSPTAAWSDIPGSGTGVCAVTGGATCGAVPLVTGGSKVGMSFDWNIGGDDGTVDSIAEAQQYCVYGLTPPSPFTCNDCPISTPTDGTRAFDGVSATAPCERKLWDHQCMLVELDSDSGINIETQSVYRNMDVRQMSEVSREAMISLKGLPPIPGAQQEDIYLVVMPRNVPASLPAGTTGTSMISQNAGRARDTVMRPFVEAARGMSDAEYQEASRVVREMEYGGNGYGGQRYGGFDPEIYEYPGEQIPQADLPKGVDLMPRGVRAVAEYLDGVSRWNATAEEKTLQTIDTLDDVTATTILPTVDIYVFRHMKGKMMSPLSSFTLVVHHEGPLYGISWQIDGATKLSRNLFKLEMPVGHKRDVRVRVMAKESPSDRQQPGDEKWPCPPGGCCHKQCSATMPDVAVNFGLPFFFVGAVLMGRGRRRKK